MFNRCEETRLELLGRYPSGHGFDELGYAVLVKLVPLGRQFRFGLVGPFVVRDEGGRLDQAITDGTPRIDFEFRDVRRTRSGQGRGHRRAGMCRRASRGGVVRSTGSGAKDLGYGGSGHCTNLSDARDVNPGQIEVRDERRRRVDRGEEHD